ncbi:class II aldolase/adducin family protein [Mesoaciditoga lauensis]|uniref:class II aldolase/adducin family protein n=1 Tax=Mesoaciditoga lauensis TaxID=1495039 RepID=UPI001FDF79F6|nr:class II aldolase/adducin family protein [Mesoaciditoga lauensis]
MEKLVEYSRLCWDRGLTESTGGNMSVRIDDKSIYITPTFTIKHFLKVEDMVKLNLEGEKLNGKREPSSERKMHLLIYKERTDVKAIFHAHPPYVTSFAVSGERIPINALPESVLLLKNIAYLPYKTPGTQDFADVFTTELKKGKDIFILQNHGVTVVGKSIEEAYARLETLEFLAKVILINEMSKKSIKKLSSKEINELLKEQS